ncbi:MAG: type II toxin-antitoxin system HicB family antitoxin [Chloroflexi bacterium]|nr:type II toxin-antitoxin system HicB family antitoxin [Chloroflexota bacterium]MDA8187380.1 type II toxin-antitoxin system HicB family antitoxin [Dehalococcoidales bacterium]
MIEVENTYAVPVKISKQEDGLWRAECPEFPGCFVDNADLSKALSEIQDVIRMYIELYREQGKPLPEPIGIDATTLITVIPVAA